MRTIKLKENGADVAIRQKDASRLSYILRRCVDFREAEKILKELLS